MVKYKKNNLQEWHKTKKMRKFKIFFFAPFCLFCSSCAFLVLSYNELVLRPFNSGSFDMRTNNVLSAVWQLAAFKNTL